MPLVETVKNNEIKQIESLLYSKISNHEWTIHSVIDDLLPVMVMQSNLQYKNFHLVKMALFIRRLAHDKLFSRETEYQLARMLCLEIPKTQWVDIKADWMDTNEDFSIFTIANLKREIENHNVHNAFYYAVGLLNHDPDTLNQFLLVKSAEYLSSTLGHSFSCFLPFALDMIHCHHPYAPSALLSYIMYLCRFNKEDSVKNPETGDFLNIQQMAELIKVAASGDGIVNLHHMITLYTYIEWECAPFNKDKFVPFVGLRRWIGEKEIDLEREKIVKQIYRLESFPRDFNEFFNLFSLYNPTNTALHVLSMLEANPRQTIDWLYLAYLQYYKPGKWDPHYITSLHSAIGLYRCPNFRTCAARRMPVVQAIKYFADGIYR